MGKTKAAAIVAWVLCIFLFSWIPTSWTSEVYIVYMGSKVHEDPDITSAYNHQLLASAYDGSMEKAKSSMVYSYKHGFRGFAAHLSKAQAVDLAKMPGVVSAFPNKKRKLHTTHSWEFLGMPNDNSLEDPNDSTRPQEDVIIGIIDTGVWPESPSFSDDLMSPVPSRWKGECQSGELFPSSTCNRKLIGARYYSNGLEAEKGGTLHTASLKDFIEYRSARDTMGHGSHTASTAAGRYVSNMNYNGLAAGGARGGAPLARIAVYKTCWQSGCYDSDILAAFDDAIKDGVDILSLSLGPDVPENDYMSDAIAVGSFHATQNGITVVCSVGNDGTPASATNLAPWVITVAASTTDRNFISTIILSGSNVIYSGESLNSAQINNSARLLYAADAPAKYFTPFQSSFCLNSSLNKSKVAGKILVCLHPEGSSETRISKSQTVQASGGVGMILIDEIGENLAIPFVIPSAIVGDKIGAAILNYINSTRFPQAYISPAQTIMGYRPAPQVAAFSSKGPNTLTPDILKPDITAPGLNILAAWTQVNKDIDFNIVSGTSMACPHVTGMAALIKAAQPSWTPSAIKSALMTTATVLDKENNIITAASEGKTANPFDFGAGIISPMEVTNPGLVYDAGPIDYKNFLCAIGYDDASLRLVTGDQSVCTRFPPSASNLNYPSITISKFNGSSSVVRTVTNVGSPRSIYRARVSPPRGIIVKVVPNVLVFNSYGQNKTFTVYLKGKVTAQTYFKGTTQTKGYAFGSLFWVNGKQIVRSPLVVGSFSY
ncbi:subtilisin-like serine-protease S isoform X2 [Cryptomeria japonica]|nr:subtilisin-like serine-protease S isoform X2 [Cryptomeria japonica]XP_057844173.2 subtilisin-like serine-protease S isoform X2 [Cryptomeria japonica]